MAKDSKAVKGSNREIFNNVKSETYKQRVKVILLYFKKEEKILEPIEEKNF